MKKKKGMVGKWFHAIGKDGFIDYQGVILDEVKKNLYVVQYFDWLMGEPCDQKLVVIEDMKDWIFYNSGDDMRFAYEYGNSRRLRRTEKSFENQ